MDTDEILEEIGSYGLFQKRNSLLLGLIIFVLTFQTVSMVFIGGEPRWRCKGNSSICTRNETFSSYDGFYKARCNMSSDDWEFTTEFTSIITEWNLICGAEYYASLSQSILFIGWIPGAFIIGRLSDKFGRKQVLFPAVFFVAVSSLASSFVPVLWLFLTLRGITGFFQGGVYITLYVLTTEFVGPKHRSLAGTVVWIFYTSSLMILSGLAYGIREWRTLSIVISAPAFLLLIFWRWVPESCRWLIVHSRVGEARKVFSLIATINKKQLPTEKLALAENNHNAVEEGGFLDLVHTRIQLIQTVILWFAWFTNSMVYYGVLLSVGVLGGNLYLNFFLTSAIDIPSNFFVIWFMSWEKGILCKSFYGRKRALILCMNLAAVFCITVSLIPPESDSGSTAARVIFTVLGKFCINASFSTIYVFSSELLPTVIRNLGMGSMAAFDQAGASIAPFVVLLDKTHPVIPFAVMSGFACASGCLCGLLPETLGRRTLETLEDISHASPLHDELRDSDQSEEHLTSSV
nr:solute carrier family 22 member 15-like isoform X1 [Pocillopora verrucosa]